jgi:HD-GYP domain-containing protein (c-di-GMP phosphodiesterase class II)
MSMSTLVVLWGTILATVALVLYRRLGLARRMDGLLRDSGLAFSTAIELRFPELAGSTQEVLQLALRTADALGLPRKAKVNLEVAVCFSDIGLCEVPFRHLNSTELWNLSTSQRLRSLRHPVVGAAMLEQIPSLRRLAAIVRSHHTPYQYGRERLPLESRVIAACAFYERLSRSESAATALSRLARLSGTRFDPRVVKALQTVLTSPRGARCSEPVWHA